MVGERAQFSLNCGYRDVLEKSEARQAETQKTHSSYNSEHHLSLAVGYILRPSGDCLADYHIPSRCAGLAAEGARRSQGEVGEGAALGWSFVSEEAESSLELPTPPRGAFSSSAYPSPTPWTEAWGQDGKASARPGLGNEDPTVMGQLLWPAVWWFLCKLNIVTT